MPTTQPNPQERIARQLLTQTGTPIGTDAENCTHYWDSYEQAVAVVPRDATDTADADRFDLADTPCETLGQWCEHVRSQRGWDVGPRVGGTIVEDLQRALA